jgi:hypothetical protein
MADTIGVEERELLQPFIDRAILKTRDAVRAAKLLAFEMPWMVRADWEAYYDLRKKQLHEELSQEFVRIDVSGRRCECGHESNVFFAIGLGGDLIVEVCDLCAYRHLESLGGSIPDRVTRSDVLRQRGDS